MKIHLLLIILFCKQIVKFAIPSDPDPGAEETEYESEIDVNCVESEYENYNTEDETESLLIRQETDQGQGYDEYEYEEVRPEQNLVRFIRPESHYDDVIRNKEVNEDVESDISSESYLQIVPSPTIIQPLQSQIQMPTISHTPTKGNSRIGGSSPRMWNAPNVGPIVTPRSIANASSPNNQKVRSYNDFNRERSGTYDRYSYNTVRSPDVTTRVSQSNVVRNLRFEQSPTKPFFLSRKGSPPAIAITAPSPNPKKTNTVPSPEKRIYSQIVYDEMDMVESQSGNSNTSSTTENSAQKSVQNVIIPMTLDISNRYSSCGFDYQQGDNVETYTAYVGTAFTQILFKRKMIWHTHTNHGLVVQVYRSGCCSRISLVKIQCTMNNTRIFERKWYGKWIEVKDGFVLDIGEMKNTRNYSFVERDGIKSYTAVNGYKIREVVKTKKCVLSRCGMCKRHVIWSNTSFRPVRYGIKVLVKKGPYRKWVLIIMGDGSYLLFRRERGSSNSSGNTGCGNGCDSSACDSAVKNLREWVNVTEQMMKIDRIRFYTREGREFSRRVRYIGFSQCLVPMERVRANNDHNQWNNSYERDEAGVACSMVTHKRKILWSSESPKNALMVCLELERNAVVLHADDETVLLTL